jgi:hypothetical protein
MEHAQLDSKGWSHLLARLGGEKAIASSAREHGAFVRARGVKSAVDVLRLALMYGPGGQSLRSLAALAAAAGLADISDVAILDRLKNVGNWLQALCEETLARIAKKIGAKAGTRPIRIVDGSRLEGPGERVWRLHLCYVAASRQQRRSAPAQPLRTAPGGERYHTRAERSEGLNQGSGRVHKCAVLWLRW